MAVELFAEQLRRHRTLAGLSQQALAARAGLSRRGIADLERGARRTPYPDTARRLADALQLGDVERDAFMAACRPARSLTPSARHRLPTELASLVGRQRELGELLDLVNDTQVLTLTGAGGIGKTRLALELAHRMEPFFDDGAVVVDLAPVVEAGKVSDAIAAVLGLTLGRDSSALQEVVEYLQDRQLLIMLDNCEHLVAGCARVVDTVLRGTRGLKLLVTSREALRIPGETVWVVPALRQDEAVALFLERATGSQPRTLGTADRSGGAVDIPRLVDLEAVGAMCRYLEGIPLAIELTAVRVPVLGIMQVAELLTDRLASLSRGGRLDPPRHKTLRAALDWSHALLTPEEQRLFARLAVFVGGWTLPGAAAMDPEDGSDGVVEESSVVDLLIGLVDKSLVLTEDVEGCRRFRFLETIRQYALERLGSSGEEPHVRERHVGYLLAITQDGAASRLGVWYPAEMERVRAEWANLQAALVWLRDQQRFEDGLALCSALSGFWLGQGLLRNGEEWLEIFLADPARVSPRALAAGLHARGRLAEYGGAFDRSLDLYQRSLATSIEHGDRIVEARAMCGLGDLALHHGAYAEAHERFRAALPAARSAGADAETAQCLLSLGRSAALLGDREECRTRLEQALAIERRLGDRWGIAYVLQLSGEQARQAGRLREAQGLLEEAHVLWRQAGTRMGERAAVMTLALVTAHLGELPRARGLASEALQVSEELDDTASATTVRVVEIVAEVLWASGQTTTAVHLLSAATARREVIAAPRPGAEQPEMDALLGHARAELGHHLFATAWAAGRELAMDRAVELATAALATSTRGVPATN